MLGMSLHRGAAVADKLLDRFGSDRLVQVEQLSDNSFCVWLAGGDIALAVIGADGQIRIKEVEADPS